METARRWSHHVTIFNRHIAAAAAMLVMLAGSSAPAATTVAVVRGGSYGSRIFPDDAFTVGDKSQLTGRRINFRQGVDYPKVGGIVQPSCTDPDYSICDAFAQLNTLDGFDLQPPYGNLSPHDTVEKLAANTPAPLPVETAQSGQANARSGMFRAAIPD